MLEVDKVEKVWLLWDVARVVDVIVSMKDTSAVVCDSIKYSGHVVHTSCGNTVWCLYKYTASASTEFPCVNQSPSHYSEKEPWLLSILEWSIILLFRRNYLSSYLLSSHIVLEWLYIFQ